jgi:hypothetical protein
MLIDWDKTGLRKLHESEKSAAKDYIEGKCTALYLCNVIGDSFSWQLKEHSTIETFLEVNGYEHFSRDVTSMRQRRIDYLKWAIS